MTARQWQVGKRRVLKVTMGRRWAEYAWGSDLEFIFPVALCVCFRIELQGANESAEERAVMLHRKWKIILPFNIKYFLSGSLWVKLYSHNLSSCRSALGCLLAELINDSSLSSPSCLHWRSSLVNASPAWQGHWGSSQVRPSIIFFLLSHGL